MGTDGFGGDVLAWGGLFRWTIWTVLSIFRDYVREPSLGLWADLWRAILPRSQQRESRTLFCQFLPSSCLLFYLSFIFLHIFDIFLDGDEKNATFSYFWGEGRECLYYRIGVLFNLLVNRLSSELCLESP